MFTVPGWSLSTSVPATESGESTSRTLSGSNKLSKKRKRGTIPIETTNTEPGQRYVEAKETSNPFTNGNKIIKSGRPRYTSKNKGEETHPFSDGHVGSITSVDDDSKRYVKSKQAKKRHSEHGEWRNSESERQKVKVFGNLKLETETRISLTPMQSAMRQKLISARFRHLNQTLYTRPSEEAAALFEKNPTFFNEYHTGFRQQVASWPENPVDSYVEEVRSRGLLRDRREQDNLETHLGTKLNKPKHPKHLPRTKGRCNIADLGCGDASFAQQLAPDMKKLRIMISSFDLVSYSPKVTKADIASLPVESEIFDVAILCLALMGTNWIDFIEEAWRILRWKGELWVAEIKSRFCGRKMAHMVNHSIGKTYNRKRVPSPESMKDETKALKEQLSVEVDGVEPKSSTDVSRFIQLLHCRGFQLVADEDGIDVSNKMFVMMKFVKITQPLKGRHGLSGRKGLKTKMSQAGLADEEDKSGEADILKPCLYKTR